MRVRGPGPETAAAAGRRRGVSGGRGSAGADEEPPAGADEGSTPGADEEAPAGADEESAGADAERSSASALAREDSSASSDRGPPPIRAPDVAPLAFVAYPDQECFFEILPESTFAAYRASRLADARCAYTSAKVAGPEPDVVNHSFLAPVARDAQTPAPPATIRVAEPRNPEPARAGRVSAMPTLRTPSVPAFPEAPDALVIPRAAAVRHHVSGEGWGVAAAEGTFTTTTFTTRGGSKFVGGATTARHADTTTPSAFVFRQVVEYPPVSDALLEALDEALVAQAASFDADSAVDPRAYLLADLRGDVIRTTEQNLADRVVAARMTKERAYEARQKAEEERLEAEELAEAERAMANGVAEMANEIRYAPRGRTPEPWQKPMFPPCNFFAAEEGSEALELLRTMPKRPPLPKRPDPEPLELPEPVKLAREEPKDPNAVRTTLGGGTFEGSSVQGVKTRSTPSLASFPGDRTRRFGYSDGTRTGAPDGSYYLGEDHHSGGRLSHASPRRPTHRTTRLPGRARRDVLGNPREEKMAPEAIYRRDVALSARNDAYDDIPGNARRPLRTTSVSLASSRLRDPHRDAPPHFELAPAHVSFGRVPVGASVARTALLTNVSGDLARFSLRQPDRTGPFSVAFQPGMVSPGLAARLKVRCDATRAGDFVDEVVVTTERRVFVLGVSAKIVGPEEAENAGGGDAGNSRRMEAKGGTSAGLADDPSEVRLDPDLTLDEVKDRERAKREARASAEFATRRRGGARVR